MKKLILIFAAAFAFSGSIFSDPNFSQPTNHFSPGQTVYVKVESFVNGDREKALRLLDAEKREIQRLNLSRQDNIFTASFQAPPNPGVYYVDIKIRDSQGSVYSSQENITVGEASSQSVSSEAIAITEAGEGQVEEKTQPTPELKVQEETLPEIQPNFFSQFLEKLFSFLRKIFRFDFGT